MDLVNFTDEIEKSHTRIWAVGSGKGGVGKTFVSSSLAISLSKLGHSVVVVDLDITGANTHTCLGMSPSHLNLRHYFDGSKSLSEITVPSPMPHLSLIQGLWDSWNLFELTSDRVEKLIADLRQLKVDYVIVDLGAGATHGNIEVFKNVDERILVTNPEPTALEKNYRFIEALLCAEVQTSTTPEKYMAWIQMLRDKRHGIDTKKMSNKSYISEFMPESMATFEALCEKPVHLVMNSIRSIEQEDLGYSVRSVCKKYFDLEIHFLGFLIFDNAVWQSVKTHTPVLVSHPFTPLAGQFLNLCKQLIAPEELRAVV